MKATTILSLIGLSLVLAVSGCKKKESTEVVPEPQVDSTRIDGTFTFIRNSNLVSGWFVNENEAAIFSLFNAPQPWDAALRTPGVDAGVVKLNGQILTPDQTNVYTIEKDTCNALGLDAIRIVQVSGSATFPTFFQNFGPFPSFTWPDTVRKSLGIRLKFNAGLAPTDTVFVGIDTLHWELVPDAKHQIQIPPSALSSLSKNTYKLNVSLFTSKSIRSGGRHFRCNTHMMFSNLILVVD